MNITNNTLIINEQINSDNKLNKYSKNKINEINSRNGIIATTKKELEKYVYEAFENTQSKKDIHIGVISSNTINRIKYEITGIKNEEIQILFAENKEYDLAITQDTIRHIKKKNMTIENVLDIILKIDEIVINFDTVQKTIYEKGKQKNNGLRFKKKFPEETYYAVELIYKQKKVLNTQTIFMDKIDFKSIKKKPT